MRITFKGDENTTARGQRFVMEYKGKCQKKLHPEYPLCFVHYNKNGKIKNDIPWSIKEVKIMKKFFAKIKI